MSTTLRVASQKLGTAGGMNEFLSKLRKKYKKRIEQIAVIEANKIIKKLVESTPVDTGLAVGNTNDPRVKRSPYPSHPAVRYSVPNLGWTVKEIERIDKDRVTISIGNPMWRYYLRFVNMGIPSPRTAGFVQQAWANYVNEASRRGLK